MGREEQVASVMKKNQVQKGAAADAPNASDDVMDRLDDLRARAGSPTERNGIRLGQAVSLPGVAVVFEVVGLKDPAVVDLRAPSGRLIKAGFRYLRAVRTR